MLYTLVIFAHFILKELFEIKSSNDRTCYKRPIILVMKMLVLNILPQSLIRKHCVTLKRPMMIRLAISGHYFLEMVETLETLHWRWFESSVWDRYRKPPRCFAHHETSGIPSPGSLHQAATKMGERVAEKKWLNVTASPVRLYLHVYQYNLKNTFATQNE